MAQLSAITSLFSTLKSILTSNHSLYFVLPKISVSVTVQDQKCSSQQFQCSCFQNLAKWIESAMCPLLKKCWKYWGSFWRFCLAWFLFSLLLGFFSIFFFHFRPYFLQKDDSFFPLHYFLNHARFSSLSREGNSCK